MSDHALSHVTFSRTKPLYAYMRYIVTATTNTTKPISMKHPFPIGGMTNPTPDFTIGELLGAVKLCVSSLCGMRPLHVENQIKKFPSLELDSAPDEILCASSGIEVPFRLLLRPPEVVTSDDTCILKTSALRYLASTPTSWKSRWTSARESPATSISSAC